MFVKIADDRNVSSFITADKPVLLKLGATWCGPCKAIKPALESLAQDRESSLTVLDMDIDDSPKTPQSLQVMSVPTMILFIKGQEVSRKVGSMSKAALEAWIDSETKK